MPNPRSYAPTSLTRVTEKPGTFYGYTFTAWLKFYGLIAGLWFALAFSYIHYLALFDDLYNKPAGYQSFVFWFTGLPLAFGIPIILLFFWWAAGALVRYARWQMAQPVLWQWFWMLILVFYGYVLLDPLDSIHPQMSRKGLAPLVNLTELIANWPQLAHDHKLWPPPLYQFQWGYFLLYFLFWFLLLALHWQYFLDFLREAWFYARRFQRYGVSILTGFRETNRLAHSTPVTRDYPRERPSLPPVYRGVPRLNVPQLTPAEAQALLAADVSGALVLAPRQSSVLFVDLGCYDFSPALGELQRADGTPLVTFADYWPLPETGREALVIPLADAESGVRSPESGVMKDIASRSTSAAMDPSASRNVNPTEQLAASTPDTKLTTADSAPSSMPDSTPDDSPSSTPDAGLRTPDDLSDSPAGGSP